ncbi:nuclear transport factor 2 family protein [Aeromicrobium sp.]|uniref:nuclear transport factor 2 family protein n=1 Tax=Aeromicrobium sp. TaxID=1871063 RepID=UPI0030BAC453
MTDTAALDIARRYFEAWSGGEFDRAMELVAADITCHSPAGLVVGAEAFRAFMGPFAGMAQSTSLLAAYGDRVNAVLVYNTATPAVPEAPGAEWHRIADGRIAELRIIFDRLPFDLARRGQDS